MNKEIKKNLQNELIYWLGECIRANSDTRIRQICNSISKSAGLYRDALDLLQEEKTE